MGLKREHSYESRIHNKQHISKVKPQSLLKAKWTRRSNGAQIFCANCGNIFFSQYVQHLYCRRCYPKLLQGACITQPEKMCEICYVHPALRPHCDNPLFKRSAMRTEPWASKHFYHCGGQQCIEILDAVVDHVRALCFTGAYGKLGPNTKTICRGKSDALTVHEVYSGRKQATQEFFAEMIRQKRSRGIEMPEWLSLRSPYDDLETKDDRRLFNGKKLFDRIVMLMKATNLIQYVDSSRLPRRSIVGIAYQYPPLPDDDRRRIAASVVITQQTVRAIYRAACLNQSYEEFFATDIKREEHRLMRSMEKQKFGGNSDE